MKSIPNRSTAEPFASLQCSGTLTISSETIGNNAFERNKLLICNLVLAEGVKTIGSNAFVSCSKLKSVSFPSTLETIKGSAFSGCSGLTGSLSFPAYLTTLEDSVFEGCTGLSGDLVIPSKLATIGDVSFKNCTFTNVTINMPTIASSSFIGMGCSGTLTISSQTLCDDAFKNATLLTGKVCLTNNVNSIGTNAFTGCTSLNKTLEFNGTQAQWNAKSYKFTDSCSWGPFNAVWIVQP